MLDEIRYADDKDKGNGEEYQLIGINACAQDPHGLPVIAMTLQSTKKTNVVLQSAPESCTIIR